jgi:hypothetical protein
MLQRFAFLQYTTLRLVPHFKLKVQKNRLCLPPHFWVDCVPVQLHTLRPELDKVARIRVIHIVRLEGRAQLAVGQLVPINALEPLVPLQLAHGPVAQPGPGIPNENATDEISSIGVNVLGNVNLGVQNLLVDLLGRLSNGDNAWGKKRKKKGKSGKQTSMTEFLSR